jgi:hypothetical protein
MGNKRLEGTCRNGFVHQWKIFFNGGIDKIRNRLIIEFCLIEPIIRQQMIFEN